MFWGVILESGKRYFQVVKVSYHLSMACLEPTSRVPAEESRYVSVMIEHGKVEYILCTLEYGKLMQQPLDFMFVEGEEVSFFLNGEGTVHLTGYVLENDVHSNLDFSEISDAGVRSNLGKLLDSSSGVSNEDESESGDEDWMPKAADKRKLPKYTKPSNVPAKRVKNSNTPEKSLKISSSTTSSGSFNMKKQKRLKSASSTEFAPSNSDADSKDSESEEDEDDMESDENGEIGVDSDDESTEDSSKDQSFVPKEETPGKAHKPSGFISSPGSRKSPLLNVKPDRQDTPMKSHKHDSNASPSLLSDSQGHGRQSREKSAAKGASPARSPLNMNFNSTPGKKEAISSKKKLEGSTQIEDIRIGNGGVARRGKFVHVYYVGRLGNSEEFDSVRHGKPFSFKLGRGEVIKGLDIGIQGMKVGGKRKLVIPASQGYQNRQNGPIPPNSTLIFEVELKGLS